MPLVFAHDVIDQILHHGLYILLGNYPKIEREGVRSLTTCGVLIRHFVEKFSVECLLDILGEHGISFGVIGFSENRCQL